MKCEKKKKYNKHIELDNPKYDNGVDDFKICVGVALVQCIIL